jgi:hypothetical protein
MSVVKRKATEIYIANRMAIPAYDNLALDYDDSQVLQNITYSLDGSTVAQVNYTYDSDGDMINAQRVL